MTTSTIQEVMRMPLADREKIMAGHIIRTLNDNATAGEIYSTVALVELIWPDARCAKEDRDLRQGVFKMLPRLAIEKRMLDGFWHRGEPKWSKLLKRNVTPLLWHVFASEHVPAGEVTPPEQARRKCPHCGEVSL